MAVAFQHSLERDPNKAVDNRRKHGVGFEQAATVFRAPLAVSVYDEDHSEDEERWVTLGLAGSEALLVVVHTHQKISATEAAIRIISARLATSHEQRDYEQNV